jgi:hypothetical protein
MEVLFLGGMLHLKCSLQAAASRKHMVSQDGFFSIKINQLTWNQENSSDFDSYLYMVKKPNISTRKGNQLH